MYLWYRIHTRNPIPENALEKCMDAFAAGERKKQEQKTGRSGTVHFEGGEEKKSLSRERRTGNSTDMQLVFPVLCSSLEKPDPDAINAWRFGVLKRGRRDHAGVA